MGVKPAIFQWSRLAQDLQEAPQGFGDPRTCGACGACGWFLGPEASWSEGLFLVQVSWGRPEPLVYVAECLQVPDSNCGIQFQKHLVFISSHDHLTSGKKI